MSYKRLSEIITKRCFLDVVKALDNKIDPKELVEVQCIYNYLSSYVMPTYKDTSINVCIFDIGCGKRPTLGVYLALMYSYNVVSIDPQLDINLANHVNNIKLINKRIQFIKQSDIPYDFNHIIVIQNHGHVKYRQIRPLLNLAKTWEYITCPCCVDNRIPDKRAMHYKDSHSSSPKNEIYHYRSNLVGIA